MCCVCSVAHIACLRPWRRDRNIHLVIAITPGGAELTVCLLKSAHFWVHRTDINKHHPCSRYELLSFGVTVQTNINTVDDLMALHHYLVSPSGLNHTGNARQIVERRPLLAFNTSSSTSAMDQQPVQLSLEQPTLPHGAPPAPTAIGALVPLQVCGLVPRWSVGLFQRSGYVMQVRMTVRCASV